MGDAGIDDEEVRELQARAALAFDSGRLRDAARLYARLVEQRPEESRFHFQLALACKYAGDWPSALRHGLDALRLAGARDERMHWHAGIAATALGDWTEARRQWWALDIALAQGDGPIEDNFGPVGVRLHPWNGGETVFARRIDPARARIANVPLPSSGHRYRDLVLHDGTQVGQRHWAGHAVPVFNELQRLEASEFVTFTAFVVCGSDEEVEALLAFRDAGLGLVEDWTPALRSQCLRCTWNLPHRHSRHAVGEDWNPDRALGIAATGPEIVRGLLEAWVTEAPGKRRLEAIECREQPVPGPLATPQAWWRAP